MKNKFATHKYAAKKFASGRFAGLGVEVIPEVPTDLSDTWIAGQRRRTLHVFRRTRAWKPIATVNRTIVAKDTNQ